MNEKLFITFVILNIVNVIESKNLVKVNPFTSFFSYPTLWTRRQSVGSTLSKCWLDQSVGRSAC